MEARGLRLRSMRRERALLRRAIMKAHRLADLHRMHRPKRRVGAEVTGGRYWECWFDAGDWAPCHGVFFDPSMYLEGFPF